MLDALAEPSQTSGALRGGAFSIAGNAKALEAETVSPDIISSSNGVIKFWVDDDNLNSDVNPRISPAIDQILKPASMSVFGETVAGLFESALVRTQVVGDALETVQLNASFGEDGLSQQLMSVAKVISANEQLETDRAVFFVDIDGFDTHSDVSENLEALFEDVDAGIRSFVAEMKSQGRWDDVTIFSVSEFGRTITSNGAGTDHGD